MKKMATDFYQNRITKQELSTKMKDLSEIFNNAFDAIAIVDERGNFVYMNVSFMACVSFSKDELMKKNLLDLPIDENKDILKMAFIKASRLGNVQNIKVVFTKKDRQKAYLEASLTLMMNGKYFVFNAKDYTENIIKDDMLNTFVISCEIDIDGTIEVASDAFLRLLGYEKSELIGQNENILELQTKHGMKLLNLARTLKMWERYSGLMSGLSKDKNGFWMDTKVKPKINKYGEIVGFYVTGIDMTDKIKYYQLNEQFKNTTNQIEEKNIDDSRCNALEAIMQNMTQNWLEPLTDIGSKMDVLQKSEYTVEQMQAQIASISRTIKNLAKNMEKFKKSFEMEQLPIPTNFKKIMSSIIAMLEKNNDKQQIEIKQHLDDVPIIDSYPNEILDVILGIITNSLEAFRKRQIKKPILDISLSVVSSEIILQILDNAGGVSDEILDKVFDPHFSTKVEKGKGLGLYFAKSLIEVHMNGRLTLENNDGFTCATIAIPVKS